MENGVYNIRIHDTHSLTDASSFHWKMHSFGGILKYRYRKMHNFGGILKFDPHFFSV